MRKTLRGVISQALSSYTEETRGDWILSYPGQVVLTVSQIMWTRAVIRAIQHENSDSANDGLQAYRSILTNHINKTVELLRSNLSLQHRLTLEALIVSDVHAREVVSSLISSQVQDDSDFSWVSRVPTL